MTNISVIAKPYAKAAFEFANEHNLLQQWSKLLQTFSELIKDKSVAAIVSSPTISQIEVVDALKTVRRKLFNFLALIAENKNVDNARNSRSVRVYKNIHNNVRVADVTLAYATDKNILDSLKTSLEKKFGCTIDMHINIDPAIIGGAVVKVGDTVIDSSVSGHLEKLKSILLS